MVFTGGLETSGCNNCCFCPVELCIGNIKTFCNLVRSLQCKWFGNACCKLTKHLMADQQHFQASASYGNELHWSQHGHNHVGYWSWHVAFADYCSKSKSHDLSDHNSNTWANIMTLDVWNCGDCTMPYCTPVYNYKMLRCLTNSGTIL